MKILLTAPYNKSAQQVLEDKIGEVIYRPWKENGHAYSEDELIGLLNETRADALITEHDNVSKKVIKCFPNLEFIGVCRGTPSNVALKEASLSGIPVFFTPARNAQAVAEMFISNVIMFMRKTTEGVEWLKKGGWGNGTHTSYLEFKGNELAGKTVGMVGFGAIGQRIANIIKCFPCTILFYDPFVESTDPAYCKTSLENLFASSDIVSVHLPENDVTRNMIDKKYLSIMKQHSIFVNTARASVVKRADLMDVLKNKKIRGAILDVFDNEPPDEKDTEMINLPNVMATPHIAGATFEVEDHHASIMNDTLIEWFSSDKKAIQLLVNKEALAIRS
jgi:D-3-phosphoglycerate dehydrogenase / 2-oxoglutarate reductase